MAIFREEMHIPELTKGSSKFGRGESNPVLPPTQVLGTVQSSGDTCRKGDEKTAFGRGESNPGLLRTPTNRDAKEGSRDNSSRTCTQVQTQIIQRIEGENQGGALDTHSEAEAVDTWMDEDSEVHRTIRTSGLRSRNADLGPRDSKLGPQNSGLRSQNSLGSGSGFASESESGDGPGSGFRVSQDAGQERTAFGSVPVPVDLYLSTQKQVENQKTGFLRGWRGRDIKWMDGWMDGGGMWAWGHGGM
ncbi:hypothetical protein B0H11DRAFT_1932399 [Mycena galericulata]|nr:hypothetical protein B0H11DRAFT_1932399 [Mycena galericulata]